MQQLLECQSWILSAGQPSKEINQDWDRPIQRILETDMRSWADQIQSANWKLKQRNI